MCRKPPTLDTSSLKNLPPSLVTDDYYKPSHIKTSTGENFPRTVSIILSFGLRCSIDTPHFRLLVPARFEDFSIDFDMDLALDADNSPLGSRVNPWHNN